MNNLIIIIIFNVLYNIHKKLDVI